MLADYSHLIGGMAGGFASTLVCHPLDFLRIRKRGQCPTTSIQKLLACVLYRCASQRRSRHLPRPDAESDCGATKLGPLLPYVSFVWLVLVIAFSYHSIHARLLNTSDPSKQLFFSNFLVGCASGTIVMALTNPLWVVKTRLCLQYDHSTKQYTGMIDCLQKTYRSEGVRGLYKGFVPGLIGTVNGSIQFACYNFLKSRRCASLGLSADHKLVNTVYLREPNFQDTFDYLLFSSVSKIFSVLSTYPYQVIRTRLQDHNVVYRGLRDCVEQTWKRESIAGMYKGALIAVVKQTPASVVTFVTYEHARRLAQSF